MNSDSPAQAYHWTSVGPSTGGPAEPWFMRAVTYSEPNGDYDAGCWLRVSGYDIDGLKFTARTRCREVYTTYLCSSNEWWPAPPSPSPSPPLPPPSPAPRWPPPGLPAPPFSPIALPPRGMLVVASRSGVELACATDANTSTADGRAILPQCCEELGYEPGILRFVEPATQDGV